MTRLHIRTWCQEKNLDTMFFVLYSIRGDDMNDKIEQGDLYDFYGELLNDHQRSIYEDFVLNDLSLGEIASERGISRQAVHDVIRRSTKILEEYEGKLHLIAKFVRIKEKVRTIDALVQESEQKCTDDVLSQISAISNEILEEL